MSLARALLRRRIIIGPGLETLQPEAAASRYRVDLENAGFNLAGKRVLVFGYGGYFALGCSLLRSGAGQVILCDKFAPPDNQRNRPLLTHYADYLALVDGQVAPKNGGLELLEADIRQVVKDRRMDAVDIVVSTSVFEHLDDVEGITGALAAITCPEGIGLHYIDLRDHYFKYPFGMLCYPTHIWRDWLNPGSNLNRYRVWDYRRVFESSYGAVEIQILQQDVKAFEQARSQIRPEYISGNSEEDSATHIHVIARSPANPIYGQS